MLFSDTYHTISGETTGEYRDRGSKFLAYAFPVSTEEDFKIRLQELKKEHHQAVHHCSALVLGPDKAFTKFSDDREPANSAGRPILRAILSHDLTNTGVIVVRYFGGKLLGVPGLIAAYEGAATDALRNADKITGYITEQYEMTAPFGTESEVFRIIRQFGLTVLRHQQENNISVIFEVRRSEADKVLQAIRTFHLLSVRHHATQKQ